MGRKSPIYGVGMNDVDYVVQPTINGRKVWCKYYAKWTGVLERCYSNIYQAKFPTYLGCTVVKEWKSFSNFKAWMEQQDWKGKEIDKDILVIGNKVYGPDTCCFVYAETNYLILTKKKSGNLPIGVKKNYNNFSAAISLRGKRKYLGTYCTPNEASAIYCTEKAREIRRQAHEFGYSKDIKEGLLRWADHYENEKVQ